VTWLRAALILGLGVGILAVGLFAFIAREGERLTVATAGLAPPGSGLTGPAASPAPPAPPPVSLPGVGQPAVHAGIRYTVLSIADPEPPGTFPVPGGRRRLGLELRLEAVDTTVTYNFSVLRLRASDGTDYPWALTNQDPPLRFGTLRAGEPITGWVAFDLPTDARPVALQVGLGSRAVPLVSFE
jgi:hypothetical protein